MRTDFSFVSDLQYKVKHLSGLVKGYESGERYVKLHEEHQRELRAKDRLILKLKLALGKANSESITFRNNWFDVSQDVEQEHAKEVERLLRLLEAMEKRAIRAEVELDGLREKYREKNKELYQAQTELCEERGRNKKLMAQINRDHENSSVSSSVSNKRKKVQNSREKTGRRPGGQPGHEGHARKRRTPTKETFIPAPKEYLDSPDYALTGKTIKRQLVNLKIELVVEEFGTPEFKNLRTGQFVHAEFPAGVVNDVNYGGSVKAVPFLLTSYCNVSHDKARAFLSDLTGGRLRLSKGMLNGLNKEFSQKTEKEQRAVAADLLLSPVLNADFTGMKVNGKSAQVLVCATPELARYYAREKKGHEGIKETLVEDYQGVLVHDHDTTFYRYGGAHQECLSHILRYLKGSMENEASLSWNKQMHGLLREMIHCRNGLEDGSPMPVDVVEAFTKRYREVLRVAADEYEYEPPDKYYREGYNLFRRLEKYEESHLRFLHDPRVPTSNNLAERLLRILKRKMKQAMSFRSFASLSHFCEALGMIELLRKQEDANLFEHVIAAFE
jgi:hypothetical protein